MKVKIAPKLFNTLPKLDPKIVHKLLIFYPNTIWDKVFKLILLGPFLNTLSHIRAFTRKEMHQL